jgi:hypothetical protein
MNGWLIGCLSEWLHELLSGMSDEILDEWLQEWMINDGCKLCNK